MERRSPKEHEPDTEDPPVSRVTMPSKTKYFYDFPVGKSEVNIYLLSAELLSGFYLYERKLVAVKTIVNVRPGMVILYREGDRFGVGRLIYDPLLILYAIKKGENEFVFLSDLKVLGEPVGYCGVEDMEHNLVKFRRLNPWG